MTKIFEQLMMPKRQLAGGYNKYRIYKSSTDFIDVSANTVQEALESSGITDAVKIEINIMTSVAILEAGALEEPSATAVPSASATTVENTALLLPAEAETTATST